MVTGTPWRASESEPARSASGAVGQPGADAAGAAPADIEQTRMPLSGHVLYVDDGTQISVTEALVLGRDPSPGGTDVRPVRVADKTRSVSKTHLIVHPTDLGVEVTDLRSTNGTAVIHDGAEHTLEPGSTVLAAPGDTVRFGERTAVVGHA